MPRKPGLSVKYPVEYHAYYDAKRRCEDQTSDCYKYYGGRGIQFRFTSFKQFIRSVGPKPSPELSLDRINNDGHYEPGNVRWATREQQLENRRNPWPAYWMRKGARLQLVIEKV